MAELELGVSWSTELLSLLVVVLTSIPYALSTLLPTAMFLAMVLVAFGAKAVLAFTRLIGLSLLERVCDDPVDTAKPATLLMSALWIAAISGTLLWNALLLVNSYAAQFLTNVP